MSFLTSQFDFMDACAVAMTAAELEIPQSPPDIGRNQSYALPKGSRFIIYSPGHAKEGHYVVRGWLEPAEGQPRRVDLENVHSNGHLYLDAWQIGVLEDQNRIMLWTLSSEQDGSAAITPGLALAMKAEKRAKAEMYLGYVRACLDLADERGQVEPTKRTVIDAARQMAEGLGVGKPPCYNTLREKIETYLCCTGDPLVALADSDRPGNRKSRFSPIVEEALAKAVTDAWSTPKGTWKTAQAVFGKAIRKLREEGVLPAQGDEDDVPLPSDRTIQRRMYEVNHYDRLVLRYGEDEANRRMARYIRQHLPDHPLDIVDVDHCTLNIVVIDDRYPVAYGRPDLLAFRDRATGSVLGYSIGFEKPSYESFLNGLRHSMYPKDMSAFPGLKWAQYGKGFRYGVDNALHLIGDDIKEAEKRLGFGRVEYRPGHPWEKGALERLFGIINADVVEPLPGSTGSSLEERLRFQEDRAKAQPVLTLSELDAYLTDYFCSIYHRRPQQGLGFLRSLKGVPNVLWDEGIEQTRNRNPVPSGLFVSLAGVTCRRTIQPLGVLVDHIYYQSEDLLALTAHPRHREGVQGHPGTKYLVIRDPNDLGRAWVHDPYRNLNIEVPACSAHRSYASGLRLFQHTKIVEYWNEKHGKVEDAAELEKAMQEYEASLAEYHRARRKHGTASKLARFVSKQRDRLANSRIVEAAYSEEGSAERLDPANPAPLAPSGPRKRRATSTENVPAETSVPAEEKTAPGDAGDVPTGNKKVSEPRGGAPGPAMDVEFLKTKHEGYE